MLQKAIYDKNQFCIFIILYKIVLLQTSNAKLVFHIEDLYTPITYVETRNIIDCFIEIKIDIHVS